MEPIPLISIIVPVRNGEAHVGRCLESIAALDWPADRREVIVVDNGSTDRTAEIAEAAGARVIREPRRGAAIARNVGWRASKGSLIAFTDCDCAVSPGWLRLLAPAFDDPKVGGAGGRLVPAEPQTTVEAYIIAREVLTQERALRDDPGSPPFLVTANAIYRREALEQIDGFDEWLTVNGEDADLSWRIQWAGWRLSFVPEAEVVHHHRARVRGLMRQLASYGAGTSYLFKKHRRRLGLTRFTLKEPYFEILRGLVLAPFRLIAGRDRLERLMPVYDVLAMSSYVTGKLRASLRLRVWNV